LSVFSFRLPFNREIEENKATYHSVIFFYATIINYFTIQMRVGHAIPHAQSIEKPFEGPIVTGFY